MEIGPYKAAIRIGDKTLKVYQPCHHLQSNTVAGWIASEDGKEFVIALEQSSETSLASVADVSLDGNPAFRRIFGGSFSPHEQILGVAVTPNSLRPFQFTALQTTGGS